MQNRDRLIETRPSVVVRIVMGSGGIEQKLLDIYNSVVIAKGEGVWR